MDLIQRMQKTFQNQQTIELFGKNQALTYFEHLGHHIPASWLKYA
jgi:hypothetical protein